MHMPGFTDSEVGPLSSSAKRKIVFAAACDIPVLLEGETGTGKSYAASAIHKLSKRARASFVPVNCATIPEQLAEAELFGATRGAFTGLHADRVGLISAANQGSLFLDEMLELPPAIQPKLLGFLEDGMIRRLGDIRLFHVDTRVICATHRNVNRSVEDGTLRQDLFYRIAGLRIRLEPLTERRAEFTFIIGYLLRRIGERMGCAPERMPAVSEDLREYLTEQPWPGNIRQLEQVLAVACATAQSRLVQRADLPADMLSAPRREIRFGPPASPGTHHRYVRAGEADAERSEIVRALAVNVGRRASTAAALGMSRQTLWERMRMYGLIPASPSD